MLALQRGSASRKALARSIVSLRGSATAPTPVPAPARALSETAAQPQAARDYTTERPEWRSTSDLRSSYLSFFRDKHRHLHLPSAPVVPHNDPTLLFTAAGMVPFKNVFLGNEAAPAPRVTTAQRCVRAGGKHNDLDNVGHTARHHTFFEMLGNFSFGDYFKEEATVMAWEFLTRELRLPASRLRVSVFTTDDEAARLWERVTGWREADGSQRIVRFGAADNFWQMGDTGPCGPCSEIFWDQGREVDGDRWLEIWNLVFMQFNRTPLTLGDAAAAAGAGTRPAGELAELERLISGSASSGFALSPLARPCVDTGMGLERLASVVQSASSNYEADAFAAVVAAVADAVAGARARAGLLRPRGLTSDQETAALRVIADHLRASVVLIADGVTPSSAGRGYVLRRIIRRALRYGSLLGVSEPFMHALVPAAVVAGGLGAVLPELAPPSTAAGLGLAGAGESARAKAVARILQHEEHAFASGLVRGSRLINDYIDKAVGAAALSELAASASAAAAAAATSASTVLTVPPPAATATAAVSPAAAASVAADASGRPLLPAPLAFQLYDAHGFPLDLTQLCAADRGWAVDEPGFLALLEGRKQASRATWVGAGSGATAGAAHVAYGSLVNMPGFVAGSGSSVATVAAAQSAAQTTSRNTTAAAAPAAAPELRVADDLASLWADAAGWQAAGVAPAFTGAETLVEPAAEVLAAALPALDGADRTGIGAGPDGVRLALLSVSPCPFYAVGGGQVGDRGHIAVAHCTEAGGRVVTRLPVVDTLRPYPGSAVLVVALPPGSPLLQSEEALAAALGVGATVAAAVDAPARARTSAHHTATHLLHSALRAVLADGAASTAAAGQAALSLPVLPGDADSAVQQAGSHVSPDALRFDFTFPRPLTTEELARVEDWVNTAALAAEPVTVSSMSLQAAQDSGSIALFGQKYDKEAVRVVRVGTTLADDAVGRSRTEAPATPLSQELCGGTHVTSTAAVFPFRLLTETGVSSGTRRIEAVAGAAAASVLLASARAVSAMAPAVRLHPSASATEVTAAVGKLRTRVDHLTKQVKDQQEQLQRIKLSGGHAASGVAAAPADGSFAWLQVPGWGVQALPVTMLLPTTAAADAGASSAPSAVTVNDAFDDSAHSSDDAAVEALFAHAWGTAPAFASAVSASASAPAPASASVPVPVLAPAPAWALDDDHQAVVVYAVPAGDSDDYAVFKALCGDIAQRQYAHARASGVAGSLVQLFVGESGRTLCLLSHVEVEAADAAAAAAKAVGKKGKKKAAPVDGDAAAAAAASAPTAAETALAAALATQASLAARTRSRAAGLRLSARHVWSALEAALPGSRGGGNDSSAQGTVNLDSLEAGAAKDAGRRLAQTLAGRLVARLRHMRRDAATAAAAAGGATVAPAAEAVGKETAASK